MSFGHHLVIGSLPKKKKKKVKGYGTDTCVYVGWQDAEGGGGGV